MAATAGRLGAAPRWRRDGARVAALALGVGPLLAPLVALRWDAGAPTGPAAVAYVAWIVPFLAFAVVGALLALRQPEHPVGWTFAGGAFAVVLGLAAQSYASSDRAARELVAVVPAVSFVVGWALLAVWSLLLFPDGRLPSPHWRWVPRTAAAAATVAAVARLLAPGTSTSPSLPNPLGVPALRHVAAPVGSAAFTVLLLCGLAAGASLVVRYLTADGERRAQLRWLAAAVVALVLGVLVLSPVSDTAGTLAFAAGGAAIPAAVAVAVTRYRLYDLGWLVHRAVVYVLLSAAVMAGYVLLVVLPARAAGPRPAGEQSLLVALLVAAALPLRTRAQRAVDRLFDGPGAGGRELVAGLGARLEVALSPDDVVPTVVDTVAAGLRLPYVAVVLDDGSRFERGTREGDVESFPLVHSGEHLGELLAAPRAGTSRLGRRDRDTLADLARQTGASVRAVVLADELRRSRDRLAQARESERRRLRRELHDQAASSLAAVLLGLERLAEDREDTVPQRVLVGRLRTETAGVLGTLRTLMDDLRPSVLDDVGLLEALRSRAASAAESGQLPVEVRLPAALPPLPAALEVAVYRVASEALTNIVRHAHAGSAALALHLRDQEVELEVTDDGCGQHPFRTGSGLRGTRERVEEAGGALSVLASAGGGTLVRAVLPCPSLQPVHGSGGTGG
ncbi:MAG: ATP-binding protein [Motilibacteraceae bacterium]